MHWWIHESGEDDDTFFIYADEGRGRVTLVAEVFGRQNAIEIVQSHNKEIL